MYIPGQHLLKRSPFLPPTEVRTYAKKVSQASMVGAWHAMPLPDVVSVRKS
ncbi:MAG: hypothetical protein LDL41_01910 [Coleofasciculus sp. S288]|nr:hypothetical protein [Coleofasciculus sp. S288]